MTVVMEMAKLAVSANFVNSGLRGRGIQSGVALIQVLLITTIISLLAIRFTDTARNQIDIASKFEDRIRAQFRARSVINELLFTELADSIEPVSTAQRESADFLNYTKKINYWGESFTWGKDVTISIQDLNGLAPHRYPDHPVWRRLLINQGLRFEDINRYLGEFSDIQDPDTRSWIFGDIEPRRTSSGKAYLNGYAQSDMVLRWVFSDSPPLLHTLLDFSHVRAPFRMNILHSPNQLIQALFEAETASLIIAARNNNAQSTLQLDQLLTADFTPESTNRYSSSQKKITVFAKVGDTIWHETNILKISSRAKIPFSVVSGG